MFLLNPWHGNWKIQGKSLAVRSLVTSLLKNFGCGDNRNWFSVFWFLQLIVLLLPLLHAAPSTEYPYTEFLDNLFTTIVWVFPCLFQSLGLVWGFFFLFFLINISVLFLVVFCPATSVEQWLCIAFYLEEWREKQKRGSCLFWFYFSSRVCLRVKTWKQDIRSHPSLLPTGCMALDYYFSLSSSFSTGKSKRPDG